jgi:transposase
LSSKHRVLKFLSTIGLTYTGGKNWTLAHWKYLRNVKLEGEYEIAYITLLSRLDFDLAQLRSLDGEIAKVACSERYKDLAGRLMCLRGVGVLTAMVFISEVGDTTRFRSPRQLMAYFGLVPSEKSSGETTRQGGITKTGSSRVRRVLVEAAWHYRRKPYTSEGLKKRQEGQSIEVIAHAMKAQQRLYKKFWGIANRKEMCKAAVAVARELTGFIWAVMTGHCGANNDLIVQVC